MHKSLFAFPLTVLAFVATSPARGQVVQLPTLRVFTLSTTVSVPDQGEAILGGVDRVAAWRAQRHAAGLAHVPGIGALVQDRAAGSTVSASRAQVHATIIDHAEWDAMVQGKAADSMAQSQRDHPIDRKAEFLSRHVARPSSSAESIQSIEELRNQNRLAQNERHEEALSFHRLGQNALADGRRALARHYFQMAARRTEGQLRKRLLVELERLDHDPKRPVGGTEQLVGEGERLVPAPVGLKSTSTQLARRPPR